MSDEVKCECAVYGVCGYRDAALSCRDGLYQLQHRGQEWCGIASWDGEKIHLEKAEGYVEAAIDATRLARLPGFIAIGHNRYSTTGSSIEINAQPHITPSPRLAFCGNGDIVPKSYQSLRARLEKHQVHFDSQNDGELLAKYIAYHLQRGLLLTATIRKLMTEVVGAYSALLLYHGKMYAFRDQLGIRPLVIGRRGKTWLVASETCALDVVRAKYVREVAPGELVTFESGKTPQGFHLVQKSHFHHCVFELIYFSRPDSIVFGIDAQGFRKILGQRLTQYDFPAGADVVIPVPDSSNAAALGFAQASGIPFDFGLTRNHYVGRTFIQPAQFQRDSKVRKKFNPVRAVLKGKKVIVVDDSVVRGTTSRKIVRMLRHGGAKEVHLRVASPPIQHPCFYGIDMKTREELIAANRSLEEINNFVAADSLTYLSVVDLKKAVATAGGNPNNFCYACFDGKYPTKL